jgi:protein TonB
LWAALGSLAINLGLFALMPYLLDAPDQRPVFDKLIPQINVIRLPRPERPVERREAKPPEPVAHKPAPLPKAYAKTVPADLRLDFAINPRLSGGPVVTEAPPVKITAFDTLAMPSLVDSAELDRPLMPVSRMPPVYPIAARRRGIEGWVRVRFVVDAQGDVQEVTVVESRPPGVFDDSVIRCVQGWRFRPGTLQGSPVSARAETTVRFELQ